MPAYHIYGENRPGRWLVTCDHASNRVPADVCGGDLGVSAQDMARHIAWDVGARGLAEALGATLNSPVICSDFSRLVIDANRGEDDPTLVMKLYDGTIIPANRHAGEEDLRQRLDRLYHPYHAALAGLAARRDDTVIMAIHSFTPCLKGRAPRPWPRPRRPSGRWPRRPRACRWRRRWPRRSARLTVAALCQVAAPAR